MSPINAETIADVTRALENIGVVPDGETCLQEIIRLESEHPKVRAIAKILEAESYRVTTLANLVSQS